MGMVVALVFLGLTAFLAVAVAWRAALRARAAERRARTLVRLEANLPGAVLMFDRRLRHILAVGRDLQALGLDVGSVPGRTLHEIFPAEMQPIVEPAYRAALEGRESTVELAFGDRDFFVTVSPAGATGREGLGIVAAYDVTARRRRERRLTELASRDGLTGAWNRRRLLEELEWLRHGALTGGASSGSLLFLDLNGFKRVNDVLGHEAGDELLRRVVHAAQGCVRRADVVARLGGDEFAVLLPGADPTQAERVAEKVRAAIEAVWPVGLRGGVSVGVTPIESSGVAAEELLAGADRAMYRVKRTKQLRRAS